MTLWKSLDNGTYLQKVEIRRTFMREVGAEPIVLETHCGNGALFFACYAHVRRGVAFDIEKQKATKVAVQRPTWRVYAANSIKALELGVAGDLAFTFVDVDPYGSPWEHVTALFRSKRAWAPRMAIVATDGLRLRNRIGANTPGLDDARKKFGNGTAMYENYLAACEWLIGERAREAGYRIVTFRGFYNGHTKNMTQWGAMLERGRG